MSALAASKASDSRVRPKGWSKRKWKNFKYRANIGLPHQSIAQRERCYMVYCEGGGLPTVVHVNAYIATQQAAALARQNPGKRFHVLRTHHAWLLASADTHPKGRDAKQGSVHG